MSLKFPSSDADPMQGYWVRLTSQLDRLQASVDELVAVTGASESQVEALLRHLTDPARGQTIDERLAGVLAGQEAGQEQWQTLADRLNDLGQTVTKLNRAQFKTNTLAELKDQQVATTLGVLQDVATRREQAKEDRTLLAEDRVTALRAEARGEFAANLLPALDGLEMALDSGQALLSRRHAQEAEARRIAQEREETAASPASAPPGLWQRLAWAIRGKGLPPGSDTVSAAPPVSSDQHEVTDALAAWLSGLEMVRTRFLGLLATADIYPVQAEGQRFDPHLHLAMAAESRNGVPDETVVAVLRKGYRQRGRVLRYAEVVVNRAASAQTGPATHDTVGDRQETQREAYLQYDPPSEGDES